MIFKKTLIGALAALLTGAILPVPTATGKVSPEVESPSGQISVVTVNARQIAILDTRHFNRLLGLTLALRTRPVAFDGGRQEAVTAPDVIIVQEARESNLEILAKMLRQRSDYRYEIVAAEGSSAKFLVNTDTVSINGQVVSWVDPCFPEAAGVPGRRYQLVQFVETATGAPFTVAGVHFHKNYSDAGQTDCRERNTTELRSRLESIPGPVIVGGDFNLRAVESARECDPDETSAPFAWWSSMTAPTDGGRAYIDAVRESHRLTGESMAEEWTHEQDRARTTCQGVVTNKRSRIDYLFSSGAIVAEAHADHPGWAGLEPGTRDPESTRYSDHRFVLGRFVITGPPQASTPTAVPQAGGVVSLSWEPVTDATSYVIYRGGEEGHYEEFDEVDGATTTYEDTSTQHGGSYRYAIAAVGADTAQGLESLAATAQADALGPQVTSVKPRRGAREVDRRTDIDIWFDEPVDPLSVGKDTIELTRKGRPVAGSVRQESERHLIFNPFNRLRKKAPYWIRVRPVSDQLGNRGSFFGSGFRT